MKQENSETKEKRSIFRLWENYSTYSPLSLKRRLQKEEQGAPARLTTVLSPIPRVSVPCILYYAFRGYAPRLTPLSKSFEDNEASTSTKIRCMQNSSKYDSKGSDYQDKSLKGYSPLQEGQVLSKN